MSQVGTVKLGGAEMEQDRTTEELLAEHTAAGMPDPTPQPVQPGDPGYVEPYAEATPVDPSDEDGD